MAIAQAFAAILIQAGWSPPADQLGVSSEPNLKFMRAIATAQPKAAQIPPVVREHKQVVIVRGPVDLLQQLQIQPMARLKVALQLPDDCIASAPCLASWYSNVADHTFAVKRGYHTTGTSSPSTF